MTTYQDVVAANLPLAAWAFTEASGNDFAPYFGFQHQTGYGTKLYQQTGPFATAFGLHFAAGAGIYFALATAGTPYSWNEFWFKFDAWPIGVDTYLTFIGNETANGRGFYVNHTTGHIFVYSPGGTQNFDTGVVISDASWHLLQIGQSLAVGGGDSLWLDGVARPYVPTGTVTAPNPTELDLHGGSSHVGSGVALSVAMAAYYAHDLTPAQVSATFIAKTDPAAALRLTQQAGLAAGADLALLLSYVSRTYQNAP